MEPLSLSQVADTDLSVQGFLLFTCPFCVSWLLQCDKSQIQHTLSALLFLLLGEFLKES